MSLTDNIFALKRRWPNVWERLTLTNEQSELKQFHVIESKKGLPTVKISIDGSEQFLHSKYDPVAEAKRIIDGVLEDLADSDHVLFYGIGMGYHIDQFIEARPNQSFTLYEPFAEMFQHYLSHGNLHHISNHVNQLFVEFHSSDSSLYMNQYLQSIQSKVKLVILPSYERLFFDKVNQFAEIFKNAIQLKTSQLRTNLGFEKLWTLNSIHNLKYVLKTPNMIHQCKKHFEHKPVILVSAGPSLDDEIDNLRTIKEKGLAYIFSVGSAINKLIQHGIHPDATCTYDPQLHNINVIKTIIDNGITDIPLIFGSSVGLTTLPNYPGPMFHMITSQDLVSDYLLKLSNDEKLKKVNDAPSIAVITLQLLNLLGCSQAILVGQNLAYRGEQFYADGVGYEYRGTLLNDKDKEGAITVQDVYGNTILTNPGFNRMRLNLEAVIAASPNLKVVNTTKGGANIAGAPFKNLEEVMEQDLHEKVVTKDWLNEKKNCYDLNYVRLSLQRFDRHYNEINSQIKLVIDQLNTIKRGVDQYNRQELAKQFPKFDKLFKKFENNDFHRIIIRPMNRVQYEQLTKNIVPIRSEKDIVRKGKKIIDVFSAYLNCVITDIERFSREYVKMREEILAISEGESQYA